MLFASVWPALSMLADHDQICKLQPADLTVHTLWKLGYGYTQPLHSRQHYKQITGHQTQASPRARRQVLLTGCSKRHSAVEAPMTSAYAPCKLLLWQ